MAPRSPRSCWRTFVAWRHRAQTQRDQMLRDISKNGEKVDPFQWDFEEKSRLLYTHLLGELSAKLHCKTIGIDDRNACDLYRPVNQSVDALPANAKLFVDCQLSELPRLHFDNFKNMKDLYGFKMMLKVKVAEYKNMMGFEPDHQKFSDIVWNTTQRPITW